MSARSKYVSFPGRRRLSAPGVLFRIGSAACVVLCTAAAVASSTAASAAVAKRASSAAPAFPGHIVVTNLRNAGEGSLRHAIMVANAASPVMSSFIDFAVSGTITLASPLPAISRKVTIDARSAPGTGRGPLVEINFNRNPGLRFAPGSAGSQLLGVAIDNASGNGVTLDASSITLNRDYIGLNLAGACRRQRRRRGVRVGRPRPATSSAGTAPASPGAVANVISGNGGNGIILAGSSRNTVVANRIGTNPAGTWAIGNRGDGIAITGSRQPQRDRRHRVRRPGHRPGEQPDRGQGHGDAGLRGAAAGQPDLGQRPRRRADRRGRPRQRAERELHRDDGQRGRRARQPGDGVWIDRAHGNSLVGCKFVNNPFVYYNVISGNRGNGAARHQTRTTSSCRETSSAPAPTTRPS